MNTKQGLAPIVWVVIAAVVLGGGFSVYKVAQKPKVRITSKVQELSFDFSNPAKACENRTKINNSDNQIAQFQTAVPRTKSDVKSGYDLGLRNKFGTKTDIYDYSISVYQPDGTIATAQGNVVSETWSNTNFPRDFKGFSEQEGVYKVFFSIDNKVVACDEFKIVSSPNDFISSDAPSDWKTYRNEKYGFEVKYPPDWKIIVDKNASEMSPEILEVVPKSNMPNCINDDLHNCPGLKQLFMVRTIGDLDVNNTEISWRLGNGYKSTIWERFINKNGISIVMTSPSQVLERISDEIFSTFKFTK